LPPDGADLVAADGLPLAAGEGAGWADSGATANTMTIKVKIAFFITARISPNLKLISRGSDNADQGSPL
jgi:hypothetical protein